MLEHTSVSERRACRLAGLSRDAFRHEPVPTPATQALPARLIELAQVRRRFGYRRLHDLLKPEFPTVNHKKVYRLYQAARLSVRRRRKAKRPVGERQKLLAACAPNATWSMDFVFDALANGRRIKCLAVVDDFTRENVDIAVDHGIGGKDVESRSCPDVCKQGLQMRALSLLAFKSGGARKEPPGRILAAKDQFRSCTVQSDDACQSRRRSPRASARLAGRSAL